jgi:hypothetical protein
MLEESEVIRIIFFLPKMLLELNDIVHGLDDTLACWKGGPLVTLIPFIASLDIFRCCAKCIDTKELMRYVICFCIKIDPWEIQLDKRIL